MEQIEAPALPDIRPEYRLPGNPRTIPAPPSGSIAWLDLRRKSIGGSDSPNLLLNLEGRFSDPVEVYMDKMGLKAELKDNVHMAMGRAAEPVIADIYAFETGRRLINPDLFYYSAEHSFMHAAPDRLVLSADGTSVERGLEIKRSKAVGKWGPAGSDQYPVVYYVQCQHYMAVTGLRMWDLCVMLPDDNIRVYEIPADAGMQADLVAVCSEFYHQHMRTGVAPPIDFTADSALDSVKRLNPGIVEGPPLQLSELAMSICSQHLALKQEISKKTKECKEIEARLLALMGSSGAARCGPYELARSEVKKNGYFVNPTSYVQFKLKGPKDQ